MQNTNFVSPDFTGVHPRCCTVWQLRFLHRQSTNQQKEFFCCCSHLPNPSQQKQPVCGKARNEWRGSVKDYEYFSVQLCQKKKKIIVDLLWLESTQILVQQCQLYQRHNHPLPEPAAPPALSLAMRQAARIPEHCVASTTTNDTVP